MDVDLFVKLVGLAGVGVVWGDLRRQVRALADEVRRQNGRLGKVEDLAGENAGAIAHIRGFLKL